MKDKIQTADRRPHLDNNDIDYDIFR